MGLGPRKFENYVQNLRDIATVLFFGDATGHDPQHCERVYRMALRLRASEGGDRLVLAAAAFLHDYHRLNQKKGCKTCNPKDSLQEVRKILARLRIPPRKIPRILRCIELHGESPGSIKDGIEVAIIQDADRLDYMGAIGIARAFVYAGAHGFMIFDPTVPLDNWVSDPSKPDPSEVHHLIANIAKFENGINTETARAIAKERSATQAKFVQDLFNEGIGQM